VPLTILRRVVAGTKYTAPVYLVRCTLCGDEYRCTAHHSQIQRKGGCAVCMHAARRIDGAGRLRQARYRRRERIAKHLELRGFRLVKYGP
jgi:hypothetical protein